MNERARAIAILKQAREVLSERLSARVVAAREAILEDAAGETYTSELETIYEEIGSRLVHVNALLANLPAGDDASSAEAAARPHQIVSLPQAEPVFVTSTVGAVADVAESAPTEPPASFQSFVQQIVAGQVDDAGATLTRLLDLEPGRAARCAARFQERLIHEPDFLTKAMQLRQALHTGIANDALAMLWECFGLQGIEAIAVYQTLKSRARSPEHG